MDHFWALLKTLAFFFGCILAGGSFVIFAVYGIDFISKLFTDHGQTIGAIFLVLLAISMFALEYIRRLDIEKEKRKKTKNSY